MAENQVLTSAGEEKELSELLQIRRDKLSALVEAGQNPFELTSYPVDAYAQEVKAQFTDGEEKTVHIAGRMMSRRIMGKASFAHIGPFRGDSDLCEAG